MPVASMPDGSLAVRPAPPPSLQPAGILAAALVAAAVLLAAWLARPSVGQSNLAHPGWLLPAAVWMLVPHRSRELRRMQELVFLYICVVMLTEAARCSWEVTVLSRTVRLSASVACMGLAALGRTIQALWAPDSIPRPAQPGPPMFAALCVLTMHGLVLRIALACWYGYGYEPDLAVGGRIALCILWLVLAAPLASATFVRAAASIGISALLVWSCR